MTPIEAGEEILRCIDYITKTFPENQAKLEELHKQEEDLWHLIEFTPLDVQRGYRLAKQLQDVRIQRRVIKDEQEVMCYLNEYLINGTTKSFVTGLVSALSKAKRRTEQQRLRVYSPRSQAFQPESPPVEQVVDG